MPEPLSYKDLENQVKELKQEKYQLSEQLKQKENQLVSTEKLYKQVIDNVDEGVFLIQGENFKFINQKALDLFGATKSDIENIKFSEIIHPDYRGDLIHEFSEIVESKKDVFLFNCKLITIDGRVLHAELRGEKLPLYKNQVSVLIKVINKKEIIDNENELERAKASLGLLNSFGNELIILLDKNTNTNEIFAWNVAYVNEVSIKLLNKSANDIIQKPLGQVLIPDYNYELTEELTNDFEEELELYFKNINKYYKVYLHGLSENQLICVLSDINDLFLTKGQLNKNLQRNELFTEVLQIFNLELSYFDKYKKIIDRIVYHFKPNRIYLFQHELEDRKGKLIIQYNSENVKPLADNYELLLKRLPSWLKVLQERKMILGFSLGYLPDDIRLVFEELKFENAYVFPIVVDDQVNGSVVFENDPDYEWDNTEINYIKMVSVLISSLTSRKIYEEKLVASKEKAEQADRLKSSFLASMSHDIRIPMTAIIGFSDLLADPDLTLGEREEFIELISKSGQDLLTLVDNIVDVAKIETGQLKMQKDLYSVKYILSEIFDEYAKDNRLLEYDDLEMVLDIAESYENVEIETDMFRIKQVFTNLLDNALKFTDRGVIHLGISNVWNKTIEFYVQDTGIGIAEETQNVIFERFSKIDRSYTKEYSGTGLGLSICKSLVELLDGEIRVISYPGKGSTFYFTHPLPFDFKNEQIKEKVDNKIHKNNWSGKKILIAEDVEQNFKVLEYILAPTQVEIIWKKDGRQAVNFIKDGNVPDLILMDIRMPILNGIEATKEILKIRKIPIVAQTAYTLGVEKENALDAGCVGYLSKPVNSKELYKIIDDIFKNSSIIGE